MPLPTLRLTLSATVVQLDDDFTLRYTCDSSSELVIRQGQFQDPVDLIMRIFHREIGQPFYTQLMANVPTLQPAAIPAPPPDPVIGRTPPPSYSLLEATPAPLTPQVLVVEEEGEDQFNTTDLPDVPPTPPPKRLKQVGIGWETAFVSVSRSSSTTIPTTSSLAHPSPAHITTSSRVQPSLARTRTTSTNATPPRAQPLSTYSSRTRPSLTPTSPVVSHATRASNLPAASHQHQQRVPTTPLRNVSSAGSNSRQPEALASSSTNNTAISTHETRIRNVSRGGTSVNPDFVSRISNSERSLAYLYKFQPLQLHPN